MRLYHDIYIKMSWYMRGGVTIDEAFAMSYKDREIIGNLIKENLVRQRLSMLVEHIQSEDEFNGLSKNEKLRLSFNILQELSYLECSVKISIKGRNHEMAQSITE